MSRDVHYIDCGTYLRVQRLALSQTCCHSYSFLSISNWHSAQTKLCMVLNYIMAILMLVCGGFLNGVRCATTGRIRPEVGGARHECWQVCASHSRHPYQTSALDLSEQGMKWDQMQGDQMQDYIHMGRVGEG